MSLGSLAAYSFTVQTQPVDIPSYIMPGSYYVGWALTSPATSYNTDKNFAIITNQTLSVSAAAPVLMSAASRRIHGAAGTFNLQLSSVTTNPTTEPRQGPAQTIVFTFNKPLSAASVAVTEGSATQARPHSVATM